MTKIIDMMRAAWCGRRVYGWQDWTDTTDRQAMIRDWRRGAR